jgi:hypothetical protein
VTGLQLEPRRFPADTARFAQRGQGPWYDDYKERYCFNYKFLAALERARKAAESKFGAPYATPLSSMRSQPH